MSDHPVASPRPASDPHPIRLGLVGYAGRQGRRYLDALADLDGVRIVGGTDPGDDAAQVAAAHGFRRYGSITEMISSGAPTVCLVTVPHDVHAPVTRALLAGGVHVLKEKPIAVSAGDARLLVEVARHHDRALVTLTQREFQPDFAFALDRGRRLGGRLWFNYRIHLDLPQCTTGWRAVPERAVGGTVLDLGYHAVDVITRLLGSDLDVVPRFHFVHDTSVAAGLEDHASVLVVSRSTGSGGHLDLSRHSDRYQEELEIHSPAGIVRLDAAAGTVSVFDRAAGRTTTTEFPSAPRQLWRHTVMSALALVDDRSARAAHMRHHCANARVCAEIYRQAARHTPELVPGA